MRLLLVEDEPFIAADLEMLVQAAGHEVVGVADTLAGALGIANDTRPDAAFIDVNLSDGMTGPLVARVLAQEHGIPVVFVTGNPEQLPADFAGALAVVEKPFDEWAVGELLAVIEARRAGADAPAVRRARLAGA